VDISGVELGEGSDHWGHVVGHSDLSGGDNEFVDVFGDLDERRSTF